MRVFLVNELFALRQFTGADVENLSGLDGGPEAMRFLIDKPTPGDAAEAAAPSHRRLAWLRRASPENRAVSF